MKRPLSVVFLFAALTACVPQKQWRTTPFYSGNAGAAKLEERFVIPPDLENNRLYSLAFAEFKNDGQPQDPRQLPEVLRAIDDADQRSGHHALVITFVHGWKNNAREMNNNVLDFRKQLNRIAVASCGNERSRCGVVGVYLAWSGDQVNRDWNTLRTLSYFSRRDVATHVASMPIEEALFAIMRQAKLGPERSGNHSVVVGHSFGGLILEFAISKHMEELGDELHAELGKNTSVDAYRLKTLREFADLVVLVNQAAPADHAVKLLAKYRGDLQQVSLLRPARTGCANGDTTQDCKELSRPLILSVSSTSDLATRAVLPVVETLFPPKDRAHDLGDLSLPEGLDAKKVFTTAAAHVPQLHSHNLVECQGGDCDPCLKQDASYIPAAITLPAYAPGNNTKLDKKIKYCLVQISDAWNRTPYWIFQIPPEVVPDHGGIFTDRFADFLAAFLPPLQDFRPSQQPRPAQMLYRKREYR